MAQKKVLVVGAGAIAGLNEFDSARLKPCTHAGVARGHPALSLAGVVDVDEGPARGFAERFDLAFWSVDLEAALAELRPDVVSVAVPYRRQHGVAMRILGSEARPRILVLEKPLAASLAEAEDIIETADRVGVDVLVNNDCASPVYGQLERLIAQEFEDAPLSVSAWCSSGMHAIGVHMLGILRRLLGPVATLVATEETEPVASLPFSRNFEPGDRRLQAMMSFHSGATGFFFNSALTRFTYKEIEIVFRTGKLRLSDNGGALQVWRPAEPGNSTLSYRLAEPVTVPVERGTAFNVLGDLIASAGAQETQALIGGRRGLEIYRLMDAMQRSAETARVVHFDADDLAGPS